MKNQWAILGGVRFFLAAVVLFGHVAHYTVMPQWAEKISHLDPFDAVVSFFLLSGFSISASLAREAGGWKYYERRINRIYPVYFAGFLLSALPFFIWGPMVSTNGLGFIQAPRSVWEFVADALFIGGVLTVPIATNGVLWTLGIEAQLYALAPVFKRLSAPVLLALTAPSLLAFVNYGRLTHTDFTQLRFGQGSLFCGWAFLLGFWFYQHQSALRAKALLTFLALLGACAHPAGVGDYGPLTVGITVFALIYAGQVETRYARQLTWLGDLSFPLYITHSPVQVLLAGGDASHSFWTYLCLPVLAAVIVLHAVDYPYQASVRRRGQRKTYQADKSASSASDSVLSTGDLHPDVAAPGLLHGDVHTLRER